MSSDFPYQANIVLGGHLKKRNSIFPWHASASESLELELFVEPGQLSHFQEAFAVHSAVESMMAMMPEDVFEFSGGKHLEVLVTPSVVRSDESLKTLEPADRSCFLEGERKLRFFKVYTLRNCKFECHTNFTIWACNCSDFAYVRDNDTRVCGISYDDKLCHLYYGSELKDLSVRERKSDLCSCLPTCDSVTYNFETRESKLRENE